MRLCRAKAELPVNEPIASRPVTNMRSGPIHQGRSAIGRDGTLSLDGADVSELVVRGQDTDEHRAFQIGHCLFIDEQNT